MCLSLFPSNPTDQPMLSFSLVEKNPAPNYELGASFLLLLPPPSHSPLLLPFVRCFFAFFLFALVLVFVGYFAFIVVLLLRWVLVLGLSYPGCLVPVLGPIFFNELLLACFCNFVCIIYTIRRGSSRLLAFLIDCPDGVSQCLMNYLSLRMDLWSEKGRAVLINDYSPSVNIWDFCSSSFFSLCYSRSTVNLLTSAFHLFVLLYV